MEHPGFFAKAGPFPVDAVAKETGCELAPGADAALAIADVKPLGDAGASDVSFLDNRKYLPQLDTTKAGACFIHPKLAERVPSGVIALRTEAPYRAFAKALALFYPEAMWPKAARAGGTASVDPTAVIEEGVEIEPGAVIGPEAHIGRGTRIAAGAVIGYRVHVGRKCYVGALATLVHTLVGDRVIIQTGARIGNDGFGFAMGRQGHLKVPQIGRVILQDDVEIGANTTIDRGALKDTIIGEGTKIDNLVQIGHNVVVGRHCVIVAQSGIAGSTELGDFVVMGGQSGAAGHIKIGAGAQIGGVSHPVKDVPPGARMGGTPARPLTQWAREIALLAGMARRKSGEADGGEHDE